MRERRRFERYQIAFDVNCIITGSSSATLYGKTRNIGLGGVCLDLDQVVDIGETLMVILEPPIRKDKRIAALARVIWCREAEEGSGCVCGVKFIWLSPQSLLESYLACARVISDVA